MPRHYDFMGEHWLEDPDSNTGTKPASGAAADLWQHSGDDTHTLFHFSASPSLSSPGEGHPRKTIDDYEEEMEMLIEISLSLLVFFAFFGVLAWIGTT